MTARANWFDTVGDTPAVSTPDSDPFAGYAASEMGTSVQMSMASTALKPTSPPASASAPSIPGPGPERGAEAYWLAQDFSMETSLEDLEARLSVLFQREGNLFNCEVTCPMKDLPDMTCSACPFHEVGRDTSKSALCRLGKEQERISALILCKRRGVEPSQN